MSVTLVVLFALMSCTAPNDDNPILQNVEGTDFTIKLISIDSPNGKFWISHTEIPWDIYDIFLNDVNSPDNLKAGVDAITGPTPAYALVDRGFGHQGYPAISMSAQAAQSFCTWLSLKSNRTYTIPTLEQWEQANSSDGDAWHQWNSDKTTHPIATTTPNSFGIYDMRGNVGEWVITPDGLRVVGGSFRTPAEELGTKSILVPVPQWNQTDPQLPRSPWWLADADFVGLRIMTIDGDEHE